MKKRIWLLALLAALVLSGCSWTDGKYLTVTPHKQQRQPGPSEGIRATNYRELQEALTDIIAAGTEVAAIHLGDYPENNIEQGIQRAVAYARNNDPIGAYAVEDIRYEIGSSNGEEALSVTISYCHSRSELLRIRSAADMEEAERLLGEALEAYEPGLVMLVQEFSDRDLSQYVQDYAQAHPDLVMETPQVTWNIFGTGRVRVVEVIFTYQTSRDSLRRMQSLVKPVFDSASLYVSGDGQQRQKFSQLYAFLMERFDYKLETSITPAYSLLHHGVGDSRAFATVYAAMCRGAGLECLTVTGTRSGEPRTWNIICVDGNYYHVDLLQNSQQGAYRQLLDEEMEGYVWDYSEYPACAEAAQSETAPEEISEN